MTLNMQGRSKHDYIKNYEDSISRLSTAPEDRNAQHIAVLSLARMGSLVFSRSEYERYGLSSVRHHEDIMALGGRLSKDLYLTTTGKTAIKHAQNSAKKYEAAYQDTQGYYSAINAATMSFLADMPQEIILERVKHIQQVLPPIQNLTPTDYYFIEATRAECYLLLGEVSKAKASFRSAIDFDPLNYSAHAATLKQFRLILKKQKSSLHWLDDFTPPRPVHFAGHIWKNDTSPLAPNYETIVTQISDTIQQKDIGYGYGALAAGADIIIAEILIQEGAELHVILPCDKDSFIEHSVHPFGEEWVSRFKSCLEHASSMKLLRPANNTPQRDLDLIAGHMAMGQAILKGLQFDVKPEQLLLHDKNAHNSMTSEHAAIWQNNDLSQNIIPISTNVKASIPSRITPKSIPIKMGSSEHSTIDEFESLDLALNAAFDRLSKTQNSTFALDYESDDTELILNTLTGKNLPNSILVSESIASSIALENEEKLAVTYAGVANLEDEHVDQKVIHIYTLRTIG